MPFEKFLHVFTPTPDCIRADKAVSTEYRGIFPDAMLQFWEENGFGKYGEGLIEIINPVEYRSTLETWLGREVPNYAPLAFSAFGDFFYFRKLTESDEDVCMIDVHYRSITTCVWSLEHFFEEYLTDQELIEGPLRKPLFDQAVKKLGLLARGDIYLFEPAICLGGAEKLEYVNKGNAKVHLDLLFQMGL